MHNLAVGTATAFALYCLITLAYAQARPWFADWIANERFLKGLGMDATIACTAWVALVTGVFYTTSEILFYSLWFIRATTLIGRRVPLTVRNPARYATDGTFRLSLLVGTYGGMLSLESSYIASAGHVLQTIGLIATLGTMYVAFRAQRPERR